MTTIVEIQKSQSSTAHRWITLGLILALFILRIPLVTVSILFLDREPGWISAVFQVGTYLLVAILLIWESRSLQDYHINSFAIWFLILFKPIQTLYLSEWTSLNSPLAFPKIPSLLIWIIALGLVVSFRSRLFQKSTVQWQDLKCALFGGLAGLAVVVISAYPMSFQVSQLPSGFKFSIAALLVKGVFEIPYQIGYAAISEEPVFRGFLWGFLRKSSWRDVWIWIFQAGLFVLAHSYYINTAPLSFWLIVPLGALVLGWLAWHSRSIATSMVAHGVINGLGYTMGLIVANFRL